MINDRRDSYRPATPQAPLVPAIATSREEREAVKRDCRDLYIDIDVLSRTRKTTKTTRIYVPIPASLISDDEIAESRVAISCRNVTAIKPLPPDCSFSDIETSWKVKK